MATDATQEVSQSTQADSSLAAKAGPKLMASIERLQRRISEKRPEAIEQERRQCEEREQKNEKSRRARLIETLARQAGGSRYTKYRFQNWQPASPYQEKVKQTVEEWSDTIQDRLRTGEGLLLYGPVGGGKDHLAFAAVARAVWNNGVSAAWRNGRELAGDIRDRITDEAPEWKLLEELKEPSLLVISDPLPPVGELSPHQADMLYRLVEARYADSQVTVVTLNVCDDDEADRRLGASTWDRLCHGAWKVFCQWQSYRKPSREIKP